VAHKQSIVGALPTWAKACVVAASLSACLPGDNRPEPARVFVTAEPSEATRNGFSTSDGWTIRFDRFVTALGDVDLDGPAGRDDTSCNSYSEANYERLFDFTVLERSKVAVVYGLGECSVEWRSRGPSSDTVLGAGATTSDLELMTTRGSDSYATDAPATLVVKGSAKKEGVEKLFLWIFRRSYEVDKCAAGSDDELTSVYDLEGGEEITMPLVVSGEELFRSAPEDGAPLVFEPFALADKDGNGAVDIAELEGVPISLSVESPPEGQAQPETLADLVYSYSLPRISRVAGGGPCEYELRDRR
jgi:hypothetical protein